MALGRNVVQKVGDVVRIVQTAKTQIAGLNEAFHHAQDVHKHHTLVLTDAAQEKLFATQSQLPLTPEKRAANIKQAQDYVEQCERDLDDAKDALRAIQERLKHAMKRLQLAEGTAKAVLGALDREDQYLVQRYSRTVSPVFATNFSRG